MVRQLHRIQPTHILQLTVWGKANPFAIPPAVTDLHHLNHSLKGDGSLDGTDTKGKLDLFLIHFDR